MKLFIIYLFFLASLFASNKPAHTMLESKQLFPLLHTIDSKAILMGKGEKDVFVFLDPLCKFSRKFMSTVRKNPLMLEKYKYHLFLYEIPRLKSSKAISFIYQSHNRLHTLLEIMLEDKKAYESYEATNKREETALKVAEVAKQLDVYKRPYIILSEDFKGL